VERRVRVESGGILTEARAAAYDGKAVEYVRLREMCWAACTLLWPQGTPHRLSWTMCAHQKQYGIGAAQGVSDQPRNVACGL